MWQRPRRSDPNCSILFWLCLHDESFAAACTVRQTAAALRGWFILVHQLNSCFTSNVRCYSQGTSLLSFPSLCAPCVSSRLLCFPSLCLHSADVNFSTEMVHHLATPIHSRPSNTALPAGLFPTHCFTRLPADEVTTTVCSASCAATVPVAEALVAKPLE